MVLFFFFLKQKTAYEMRISDWSSDVCSSDLGFGAACGDAGNVDPGDPDGPFAGQLGDFRPHPHGYAAAVEHCRRAGQADAIFLEFDLGAVETAGGRDRKLDARSEARLPPRERSQGRFRQHHYTAPLST